MFKSGKLLAGIFILYVNLASGASPIPAFDAATDGGNNGGTTNSLSWSHTVTGSNPLLVVCLLGASISSGQDDITSITSGGVAMTLAKKYTGAGSNNNGFSYIFILPSAPTGAHTISITSTNNHFLIAVSVSYTGTSASQPDATAVFPASGSNPFSTSINTVANNSIVFTCEGANTSGPSSGCTQRVKGAAFNEPVAYDAGPVTPAGSSSCSTQSNIVTNNDVHIMMSIQPPSVGCQMAPPNTLTSYMDCVGAGTNCGHFIFSPLTGLPDCLGTGAVCGRVTWNPYTGRLDCAGS